MNIQSNNLEIGKLPPQAVELEEAVLGTIISYGEEALIEIATILKKESFYTSVNQDIYEAILNLFYSKKPIDLLTVTAELKRVGKLESSGGAYFITALTGKIASSGNIVHYAKHIHDKYVSRELIRIGYEYTQKLYAGEEDIHDILSSYQQSIFNIDLNNSSEVTGIDKVVDECIEKMENIASGNTPRGLMSGFSSLDSILNGFQGGDLIIIAARPSVGKTAFILALLRSLSKTCPVALFLLEMSRIQVGYRLISSEANINSYNLKNPRGSVIAQVRESVDGLCNSPIFIDDSPRMSIFEFMSKARKLKRKYNIGCIAVDYLQLMTGDKSFKNYVKEIGSISRGLKQTAKELDIPIIALSQLSRDIEKRGGSPKPKLSDLRESGDIEQDADDVYFIWSPDNDISSNFRQLLISKRRNGRLGEVNFELSDDKNIWKETDNTFEVESRGSF